MANDGISATLRAIRLYLQNHPNASDSAEGVQRWWLGEDGLLVTYEEVTAALNELVMRGMIGKRRLLDGTVVYSRPPASGEHPGPKHDRD